MKRLTVWNETENRYTEDHSHDTLNWKNGSRECMNKLGEYENLEENGLLIELPYKVGSPIWYVSFNHKEIYPTTCDRFIVEGDDIIIDTSIGGFLLCDVGVTLHITEESAENYLKEYLENLK